MAKGFNLNLFFKKNENALLFVGLALIALFVFGVNADVMGDIQIFKREPEVEEVKRIGGGCQLVEGIKATRGFCKADRDYQRSLVDGRKKRDLVHECGRITREGKCNRKNDSNGKHKCKWVTNEKLQQKFRL